MFAICKLQMKATTVLLLRGVNSEYIIKNHAHFHCLL